MRFGIFDKATGELIHSYTADQKMIFAGEWGLDKYSNVQIQPEFDIRCVKRILVPERWVKEGEDDVHELPAEDGWTYIPSSYQITEDAAKKQQLALQDQISYVRSAVTGAIAFGQQLMIEFATENVLLGITQEGKSGAVLKKMESVLAAVQTGTLHEAIARANAIPESDFDGKYITAARIKIFVNKMKTYLGLPLDP